MHAGRFRGKTVGLNHKRSTFSGKIGFVRSAAGASVGLGNIWRFPYLAAKYGGGIFLLIYIILALTFGYSMIIAETSIGRMTKKSPVGYNTSMYIFCGIAILMVHGQHRTRGESRKNNIIRFFIISSIPTIIKCKNPVYATNSAKQITELLYIIKEIKYRHAKNRPKLLRQTQKAVYLHPK